MSIVQSDAYVIDIIGLFQGNLHDVNITKEILQINNNLATWLGDKDRTIIDRPFRDVVESFQNLGYDTHMPTFLKKGEKQHKTIDINNT